jgi:hypothetical protein
MLYLRYDVENYYWEVIVLVRKMVMVYIARWWSTNPGMQTAGCAVVLGSALVLQHRFSPFLSHSLNELEERALLACVGTTLLGIMAQLGVPPLAIAVLYFMLFFAAACFIAQKLREIWKKATPAVEAAVAEQTTSAGCGWEVVVQREAGSGQRPVRVMV